MKIRKPKSHKKCPRCQNKCLIAQKECEECGLVFSRLQYTSNKAAKKKLLRFDTDFIIYTNQYPNDLTWWKVLLMTFFTGIFGGHYYYTGKYIKGGLMSASFVYLIFAVVFNAQWSQNSETYLLYLPIGIAGLAWMISLVYVACKKYKVPVIVEMPEQEVVDKKPEYSRKDDNKEEKTTEETAVVVDVTAEKPRKKAKKNKHKKQSVEDVVANEEMVAEETVETKEEIVVDEAEKEEVVVDDKIEKPKKTKSSKKTDLKDNQEEKKEEE